MLAFMGVFFTDVDRLIFMSYGILQGGVMVFLIIYYPAPQSNV